MAGDIPVHEHVAIGGNGAGRTLHTYGRVRVVTGLGALTPAALTAGEATDLNPTEALGLAALRLRDSSPYRTAKLTRPRAGEAWDMAQSCTDVAPAPPRTQAPAVAPSPIADRAAPAAISTTSGYLEGTVAVGLIIVDGPTADLQFSADERTKVVAEVQNGLSWYATTNPAADISFSYDIQSVQVSAAPDPAAADLEALWRDPAMATLGFSADFNGVYAYIDSLQARLGTTWSYCAFFVKYPLSYFAYSSIGGPRLVMQYANDGWGVDNIDRVFTHETGHIFGCVDEYASSNCTCDGAWGRFGTINGNCESCNTASLPCLMKTNDFALCRFSPSHLGWGKGVAGNPGFIQGSSGTVGNFELTVPSAFDGIDHIWRDNDAAGAPWRPPVQFAQASGPVAALTMIQSTLASPPSLEMVARIGSTLNFLWRDGGPALRWRPPARIASGVSGVPSLIQSSFGRAGNFEVVSPSATGGLVHLWRNNDVPGSPWSGLTAFGSGLGAVDAVSMIQSNLGGGSLEVVARAGTRLLHLYRDIAGIWHPPTTILTGVAGNPTIIQSHFGVVGNFEVIVPSASGGLIHVWRNNDAANYPWQTPATIAASLGPVDAASLIQSNLGGGSLEVVARVGPRLFSLWRDAGPAYAWSAPRRIF